MLLAKKKENSFQTLEGHTKDVLIVLKGLVDRSSFEKFSRRWGIEKERIIRNMVLISILHDVGKSTKIFQQAIRSDSHRPDFPHALLSLPILYQVWQNNNFESLWGEEPFLEALVVVSHHSQLHSGIYDYILYRSQYKQPGFLREEADGFLKAAFEFANQRFLFSLATPKIHWEPIQKLTLGKIVENGLRELEDRAGKTSDKVKLKATYTLLLSLLKTSDYLASKNFVDKAQNGGTLHSLLSDFPLPDLPKDSEERVWKKLRNSPFRFQRELAECTSAFVIVKAPCGRGKTEGALLWFLHLRKEGKVDRLVFAMPTQITSNTMRERLANPELFGEECVGLYHGKSLLERREVAKLEGKKHEEEELDPEVEMEILKAENFWGEVMIRPITISTVDHVLYSFVHGFRQADYALGNLQTAAIVFDEVHYYDEKMLSELSQLFKILKKMQIPHLLMSGTLPSFFTKEAGIESYKHIRDEEGFHFMPFHFNKREEPLVIEEGMSLKDDFIEEVRKGHSEGMVQFIILNTVKKSQAVYKAMKDRIPEDEIELLHSRFCYAHRRDKERKVIKTLKEDRKRPFLLISTQVIEVSLDISSERMFTELAPMDALGQRVGRLNRGSPSPNEHCLIIFQPSKPYPYIKATEALPQFKRTWDLIKEGPSSYEWIEATTDEVYKDAELYRAPQLAELFERCSLFGYSFEEIRFDEDEGRIFTPRKIESPTIDVIPNDVFKELGDEALDPIYLTPAPAWWIRKSNRDDLGLFKPVEKGKRTYLLCFLPYDSKIGFEEHRIGEHPRGEIVD
ncbi:MAG: CRISPR-associated helicase Cas3' [Dehalococcoidia bacterium]|nr:CRISPR-associated helicase Cas3' [Dehalococcoidia bacterium]